MTVHAYILWRLHPLPVVRFELRPPISIGRHPTCSLRLSEDDISRFHAVIEEREGQCVVVDQGSRNGVYLQGRRVGVAPLSAGDVLRIGQTVLWLGPVRSYQGRSEARIAEEAARDTPLVLVGETGVGKRTIAREIHRRSMRDGSLLHVEEPPPEALWRMAKGSTLVCEVSDTFDELSRRAKEHDVRLIGVTTRAAPLGVPALVVPPLRERLDELPDALVTLLTRAHAATSWDTDFLEALTCHPFPLNFSELDVACRSLVGLPAPLGIQHLPHAVRAHVVEARSATTEDLSRERLADALTRHRGNVRRVAQELGLQRGQLYRVLAGFGLNPDLYRGLASPAEAPQQVPARDSEERRTLT